MTPSPITVESSLEAKVLGVEDLQPVPLSPREAEWTLTPDMVEVSFEQFHLPSSDVEFNSSLTSLIQIGTNSGRTQIPKLLTDGTPRKRKYREIIKQRDEELGRLRERVAILEKKVFSLDVNPDLTVEWQDSEIQEICAKLPPHVAECVKNCLKNTLRTPKGYRFGREVKTLALAVKFIAPLAYRYLKPLFTWPSRKILEKFVQSWPRNPGCGYSSIKALELRSRGFTEAQKHVSICCDEMSLKVHVQFERNRDLIMGLEDYGDENRTSRVATSVLAVLVQGIGGKAWNHPLAYFFVHKTCRGSVLKQYVFEIITQLQSIGLHPCQMVTDQGPNFVGFSNIVRVSRERRFFEVNGHKIFYFFDSPHLIKTT
ncbi:uncharacterized protein [Eurosta solidaginis]|uniref:uncharacterized protein n=1 Tax=Eurosta solidaginis TaxID=178769 RepID=UPI0035307690